MRVQGEHFWRVSRGIIGILVVALGATGDWSEPPRLLISLAATALLLDVAFTRRMGVTVNDEGLILHRTFRRQTLPWDRIAGFEWGRHGWTDYAKGRDQFLWARLTDGTHRQLPTFQRAGEDTPRARFFGSEHLRQRGGPTAPALETLSVARKRAAKPTGRRRR